MLCMFGANTYRVLCVAIKQDENILTSGGADGTVRVWRLGTGELITTLRGHTVSSEHVINA